VDVTLITLGLCIIILVDFLEVLPWIPLHLQSRPIFKQVRTWWWFVESNNNVETQTTIDTGAVACGVFNNV
jgi:hypothetical protein